MSEIKVVEIGHPSAAEPAFKFQSDGSVLVWDTGTSTYVPLGSGAANFSNTASGTYSDGGVNYKFITFNSSGTLTVTTAGLADILVIGGGGGGGSSSSNGVAGGSGGGAGGFVSVTSGFITSGSHTITVGGGGVGGASRPNIGNPGNNSSANGAVALGGGAGMVADILGSAASPMIAIRGGSGGGAAGSSGTTGAGPTVQVATFSGLHFGNNGGTNNDAGAGSFAGGGGGGAGGAASGRTAGVGRASAITGSSVTYAKGGNGQGTTNNISAGVNGSANTGDGGNGAGQGVAAGGNGGSGVVIIRVRTN